MREDRYWTRDVAHIAKNRFPHRCLQLKKCFTKQLERYDHPLKEKVGAISKPDKIERLLTLVSPLLRELPENGSWRRANRQGKGPSPARHESWRSSIQLILNSSSTSSRPETLHMQPSVGPRYWIIEHTGKTVSSKRWVACARPGADG
jgi:hypothetical protein